MSTIELSEDIIRATLIDRARRYAEANGASMSAIGMAAVNDSKFLKRVESGEGFNIKTYQRVIDWLDAQEGKAA